MTTTDTTQIRERLVELIQLQVLYDRLNAVRSRQGDLPQQIDDLKDKISTVQHTLSELSEQIRQIESEIRSLHVSNDSLRDHEQKLRKKLEAVRTNQEYFEIETEIKETRLTIEKNLQDIRRLQHRADALRQKHAEDETHLNELHERVAEKEKRLEIIKLHTTEQEVYLLEKIEALSQELRKHDARLFQLFERRRRSLRGGKAAVPVIPIERQEGRYACSGCYTLLPRQLHLEILQRNKIIICESCGRFLIDEEFYTEVAKSIP
ncbi:MAG: C4-type zinc ribbon domain-containing protein [Bacteroidia bacterium]|nr:C4-type zinc ribbon domain-containing protein [Bacteroidia bacterium]MCX7652258.1 C4-type zinc ribbon domain-containing protein [Bacteroidia bacterium]MDW8416520.1 C4-type zinc ribbon domain-containing protein [Bacteroidia bacterium]